MSASGNGKKCDNCQRLLTQTNRYTNTICENCFHNFNKDYRRAHVTNQAFLHAENYLAQFQNTKTLHGKLHKPFVEWLAHPGCCKYCQNLNGLVFRVVSPSKRNKNPQKEVWVGKAAENWGKRLNPYKRLPSGRLQPRLPHEKKSPVIPLHEHCRCAWMPYIQQPSRAANGPS